MRLVTAQFAGCNSLLSQGPVCTVNNRGRVERSPEFWILVAGAELDWVPCTGAATLPNTVPVPGTDTGDCIGMFGDIIGTVSKCQVRLIVDVDVEVQCNVV